MSDVCERCSWRDMTGCGFPKQYQIDIDFGAFGSVMSCNKFTETLPPNSYVKETKMESDSQHDRIVSRDKQVGGNHYKDHAIQPWDIIIEYKLDYFEGNALKYLLRRKKNRVEDLAKAIHYMEQALHMAKAESYKQPAQP